MEADYGAEETEGLLHRVDGGWLVPLGIDVAGTAWIVCSGFEGGLLVVRETDAHVVSGDLL
jgi:hypothetical protein